MTDFPLLLTVTRNPRTSDSANNAAKIFNFYQKRTLLKKKYQEKQKEPLKVEEPKLSYGVKNNSETPSLQSSRKARIMENTVSVDEFFDDLISLVRSDYANI